MQFINEIFNFERRTLSYPAQQHPEIVGRVFSPVAFSWCDDAGAARFNSWTFLPISASRNSSISVAPFALLMTQSPR
jgi:hypothetical protein